MDCPECGSDLLYYHKLFDDSERKVCFQRDMDRECWTAGAEYVDRWYDEQRAYIQTAPEICIDSSQENLEDTFARHFKDLL